MPDHLLLQNLSLNDLDSSQVSIGKINQEQLRSLVKMSASMIVNDRLNDRSSMERSSIERNTFERNSFERNKDLDYEGANINNIELFG